MMLFIDKYHAMRPASNSSMRPRVYLKTAEHVSWQAVIVPRTQPSYLQTYILVAVINDSYLSLS